ncbi:MAG TPA: hypothetical protein VID29_06165 [Solirubrobacteraceae bacterium]|jgi:hypothetical protein
MGTPRPELTVRREASRARRVRRRRGALAGLALVVLAVVLATVVGGGGATHPTAAVGHGGAAARPPAVGGGARGVHVTVTAAGRLPAPVQDAAVAASGSASALLIGGLDQSEASLSDVLRIDAGETAGAGQAGAAVRVGSLPSATHDAAASAVGGQVYLFGGGELTSFSTIVRVPGSGEASPVGQLPTPRSDLTSTTIGETVYIIGGYTGQGPLRTILAWRPGAAARVVGTLPRPLRYAAVARQGAQIVIAGGTSGVEASAEVYRFDPASGRVASFARLPAPLTHAAAVTLHGTVLVVGGRGSETNSQTRRILAISPSGVVSDVGTLPRALSDVAAVALGEAALLAGGRDSAGRVQDAILRLSVRAG